MTSQHNQRAKSYFAQPKNSKAKGFYFDTFAEYQTKSSSLTDYSGQPIHEFDIQCRCEQNFELFKKLKTTQETLFIWFETFHNISDDALLISNYFHQLGYDIYSIPKCLDDHRIYYGTSEQCGMFLVLSDETTTEEDFCNCDFSELVDHLKTIGHVVEIAPQVMLLQHP